ncbi:hypothetical protein R3I94_004261 [Phoxinus phoxinus]|uniref:Uncharacterized protein n=1 Tax=Phoxinus phoxinus TaxID=58324 RepID=A0AAN9HC49_9TELE
MRTQLRDEMVTLIRSPCQLAGGAWVLAFTAHRPRQRLRAEMMQPNPIS